MLTTLNETHLEEDSQTPMKPQHTSLQLLYVCGALEGHVMLFQILKLILKLLCLDWLQPQQHRCHT